MPKQRLKEILREITVEPVVFLFSLAALQYPAVQALYYHKVCLSSYSADICNHLQNGSFPVEEDKVQTETSHWFLYDIICFEIPSVFVSSIYGTICDSWSRKLTLVLPVVGQILNTTNTLIIALIQDSPVGFLLFGRLLSGFFGGWITMFMACSSYLSAFTSEKTRTTRIAIMEGVCSVTMAIAGLLSGIILDNTSFRFVFLLTIGIYVLVLNYIVVFVKELEEDKTNRQQLRNSNGTKNWRATKICRVIAETMKTAVKKRKYNQRKQLLMILLCMFTSLIGHAAMWECGFLMLKRRPLSWTQTMYGLWRGIGSGLRGLFVLIMIPVLRKYLHPSDTTLLFGALLSAAIGQLIFSAGTYDWIIFLSAVVYMGVDVTMTCLRSMASQMVEIYELGKIFAVVGSMQSIGVLITSAVYNSLYPLTLNVWPGLLIAAGACITVISMGITVWLHLDIKKNLRYLTLKEHIQDLDTMEDSRSNNSTKT